MASYPRSGYTDRKAARFSVPTYVRCVFHLDSGSLTLEVPPSGVSSWRAVARVLRSPLDALSCALLPDLCSLCGSPLPHLSSAPICDLCWTEIPILAGQSCTRCGDALINPDSTHCRVCRLAPPPFVRAVAYALYEEPMRGALHALKYDELLPAAKPLGKMLAQAIAKLALDAPGELLVVPVPLHRSKLESRGFNQARLLSLHALNFLRKSHPTWKLTLASTTLMRLRETASQAGLTPHQRRQNVRGAFLVSTPAAVTAKHVLLIDDIFTTGATARAASQALIKAGAASVWVATLARAQRSNPWVSDLLSENESDETGPELIHASTTLQGSYRSSSHDQPSFFARG